ncbi:MAG: hypothetical protein QGI83_18005, partial [Candidatus Latescibacteria bacterium]|nr:hypothetical protein [Candidatus Latescibacterota bacterium]
MIKAGFAEAVITPEIGQEMPGGIQKRFAQSVHDDLFATAMVLDDGQSPVAIVGIDALSVKRSVVLSAREQIGNRTGIPPAHVMVGASHTHNGGPIADCFMSESDPDYCQMVADRIARAVTEAWERREPSRLIIGSGSEDGVAFNRRFVMKDGNELTHPGKGNADIVRPAGPIDPAVGVIGAFEAEGERFLGAFVNYTCHCTLGVGGSGFSADFPYYMRRLILHGLDAPEAVVVFGNGACGDVTQVDNQSERGSEFGEARGRQVGTAVAAEALKVLTVPEGDVEDVALACRSTVLNLRARDLSGEDVEGAQRTVDAQKGETWTSEEVWARELVLLDGMNRQEPEVPAEVQMIRVGPAAVVSTPAEYFCQFGLDIKAQSPFEPTMVVELADGCVGYVPDAQAVSDQSGYEP